VGRLRRALAIFQAREPCANGVRMEIPSGTYELRFWKGMRPRNACSEGLFLSLALIDFQGIAPQESRDCLSRRFNSELRTRLSQIPGIRLAGRQVGEGDGADTEGDGRSCVVVDFLVDGSIQETTGGVVVRVRVLEGGTGIQLWGWRSPEWVVATGFSELVDDLAGQIAEVVFSCDGSEGRAVSECGDAPRWLP
jgi:TolB-like protein